MGLDSNMVVNENVEVDKTQKLRGRERARQFRQQQKNKAKARHDSKLQQRARQKNRGACRPTDETACDSSQSYPSPVSTSPPADTSNGNQGLEVRREDHVGRRDLSRPEEIQDNQHDFPGGPSSDDEHHDWRSRSPPRRRYSNRGPTPPAMFDLAIRLKSDDYKATNSKSRDRCIPGPQRYGNGLGDYRRPPRPSNEQRGASLNHVRQEGPRDRSRSPPRSRRPSPERPQVPTPPPSQRLTTYTHKSPAEISPSRKRLAEEELQSLRAKICSIEASNFLDSLQGPRHPSFERLQMPRISTDTPLPSHRQDAVSPNSLAHVHPSRKRQIEEELQLSRKKAAIHTPNTSISPRDPDRQISPPTLRLLTQPQSILVQAPTSDYFMLPSDLSMAQLLTSLQEIVDEGRSKGGFGSKAVLTAHGRR